MLYLSNFPARQTSTPLPLAKPSTQPPFQLTALLIGAGASGAIRQLGSPNGSAASAGIAASRAADSAKGMSGEKCVRMAINEVVPTLKVTLKSKFSG